MLKVPRLERTEPTDSTLIDAIQQESQENKQLAIQATLAKLQDVMHDLKAAYGNIEKGSKADKSEHRASVNSEDGTRNIKAVVRAARPHNVRSIVHPSSPVISPPKPSPSLANIEPPNYSYSL